MCVLAHMCAAWLSEGSLLPLQVPRVERMVSHEHFDLLTNPPFLLASLESVFMLCGVRGRGENTRGQSI